MLRLWRLLVRLVQLAYVIQPLSGIMLFLQVMHARQRVRDVQWLEASIIVGLITVKVKSRKLAHVQTTTTAANSRIEFRSRIGHLSQIIVNTDKSCCCFVIERTYV
jgi:hypothetical protein